MSSETERVRRGYSEEAWKARRIDLQRYARYLGDGIRIAITADDEFAAKRFGSMRMQILEEMECSYPSHSKLPSRTGRE